MPFYNKPTETELNRSSAGQDLDISSVNSVVRNSILEYVRRYQNMVTPPKMCIDRDDLTWLPDYDLGDGSSTFKVAPIMNFGYWELGTSELELKERFQINMIEYGFDTTALLDYFNTTKIGVFFRFFLPDISERLSFNLSSTPLFELTNSNSDLIRGRENPLAFNLNYETNIQSFGSDSISELQQFSIKDLQSQTTKRTVLYRTSDIDSFYIFFVAPLLINLDNGGTAVTTRPKSDLTIDTLDFSSENLDAGNRYIYVSFLFYYNAIANSVLSGG